MGNKNQIVNRLIPWSWPIFWAFLIMLVSVTPPRGYPAINIFGIDKVVHFVEFAILSALILRSLKMSGRVFSLKLSLFILITCTVYGIFIELLQIPVTGREASFFDAAANSLGSGFGIFAIRLIG